MLMCSGLNMDGDGVIIHSVASGLPLHKQDNKKIKKNGGYENEISLFLCWPWASDKRQAVTPARILLRNKHLHQHNFHV